MRVSIAAEVTEITKDLPIMGKKLFFIRRAVNYRQKNFANQWEYVTPNNVKTLDNDSTFL